MPKTHPLHHDEYFKTPTHITSHSPEHPTIPSTRNASVIKALKDLKDSTSKSLSKILTSPVRLVEDRHTRLSLQAFRTLVPYIEYEKIKSLCRMQPDHSGNEMAEGLTLLKATYESGMLGEQEFTDIIRKVSAKSGLTVSHDIDLAYEILLNHAENKDISEAETPWLSIGGANQDGQVFHAKNGCIYRTIEIDYLFIDILEISETPCICPHELVAITQCGKAVFKQPHLGEDLPSVEQAIQYFKSIGFEHDEPNIQGDGILFPECQIKTMSGEALIFDLQLKDARLLADNSVLFFNFLYPCDSVL
jgi:hypothetical protein